MEDVADDFRANRWGQRRVYGGGLEAPSKIARVRHLGIQK